MIVETFSDPQCFATLADEWLSLLSRSITNHVFQTPQFLSAWWRSFGSGKLYVMTIRDEKKLVGIFPLALESGRLHALASKEVTDYWDFLVDRQSEAAVYATFFDFLDKSDVQQVELLSLPQKSATLHAVSNVKNWHVEQRQQTVCPVILLPKTWDEYLTSIGKKQRHEIQRKWKNLQERTEFRIVVIDQNRTIDQDCADFIRLHKSSSAEKAAFWNPAQTQYFTEIVRTAAVNGWLKLYFLELEGERGATMLCFDYNQRMSLYNSGFDPRHFANFSVGNVLTSFTIQHAIELGRTYYDFLRGDEEYKLRYRAVPEPIFDLTLSRK